ncbi:MAG: type II toxin-antitoxin system VapC family toxin [Myxococcales bacterium]|nr:type II toxin-antitoxin system VapC family toxin [Myxococcales bacterium]
MSSSWRFMLDTDTASYVIRGFGNAAKNLTAHQPSEVCISAITLAELRFGADSRRSRRLNNAINGFTAGVDVAPFDGVAGAMFGKLRAQLEARGTPIGAFDTLIAAHAIALDVTLVSNNTKHFSLVRGLLITNWT